MNSLEIRDRKAILKKEATGIIQAAKNEIRELTEDENNRIQSIKEELNRLTEKLNALEAQLVGEDDNNKETNSERKMNKKFNLLSAIRSIANNQQLDAVSRAVINEGSEEMRKAGISFQGQIQLPTENRNVTVTAEGTDTVGTEVENILEPLRAKNVLVQAGAKYMTGLVGDVLIPVMNASNVNWAGEIASASSAGTTFDSAKLSPKRLTAYLDVSKQFLAQTESIDAEAVLKADIVNAINSKLEATILGNTAGSTTKPAGIFYTTGSTATISGFTDVTELESDVEDANVLGECKYIISNKAKAALRTMAKGGNTSANVMENGEIDGTPVFNTSNVYSTGVAYGDWSNLVIGQWGGIDLVVDPFTVAKEGCVRLVVNAYVDAKIVRPGTIAVATV